MKSNKQINYTLLLEKYVKHIKQCEGITYVNRCNDRHCSDIEFSKEEIEVLEKLS